MTLPITRVVNVTASSTPAPAATRGFGVTLFLTSVAKAGILDADNLTRVYGSVDEVLVDWDATDPFAIASIAAFNQNPRPLQIKVGFYDSAVVVDAATAIDAIADLNDFDSAWYRLTVEDTLRDTPIVDGLISWVQTQPKILYLGTNDELHEDVSDTTNVSARHKGTVDRTATFYHSDASLYLCVSQAASDSTFNFDDPNSAFTSKFKRLEGITPLNIRTSAVQAITGFTPALGQSVAAGHCANTYVDIGGINQTTEGSTLTPNVFLDKIAACDWVVARTEEAILNVLNQNQIVQFDDRGIQLLVNTVRSITDRARDAGFIAQDIDPETGNFLESVIITAPSAFDVPESQRQARIAPPIQVQMRFAGAIHYATVNYSVSF